MNNNYTKIVYQSEQIGKEKIVLYLTTFDLKAFEKDKNLNEIPKKRKAISYEFNKCDINNPNLMQEINNRFETMFKEIYEKQLLDMKGYIEINRKLPIENYQKHNGKNLGGDE